MRGYARLWDVTSGERITSALPGIPLRTQILTLAISPDGSTLVGGGLIRPEGGRGQVYVWSLKTAGQPVDRFETCCIEVNDLAFTPDGSRLIVATGFGNGGDVVFWDARTRRIVKRVHGDDSGVWAIDVSNDGGTLVTGGQTSVVSMWGVATYARRGPPFTGLTAPANTVDISPDGSRLVGADTAGTVLLWDVATRTTIGDPFAGPGSNEGTAASFTPDGRRVVVVSDSGSGWLWDVDPSDWETRACEIAGRSLTQLEWGKLLPDRPYHATCGS